MRKIFNISIFAAIFSLVSAARIAACPVCRQQVKSEIYNQDFLLNLLIILLPVIILLIGGCGLYFSRGFSTIFKGDGDYGERGE